MRIAIGNTNGAGTPYAQLWAVIVLLHVNPAPVAPERQFDVMTGVGAVEAPVPSPSSGDRGVIGKPDRDLMGWDSRATGPSSSDVLRQLTLGDINPLDWSGANSDLG